MNKKRLSFLFNLKISTMLKMIVGISVLFLVLTQYIYLLTFYDVSRQNLENNTKTMLEQLHENMTIYLNSIVQSADSIAYNNTVQNFLISNNYARRAEYYRYINDLFHNITSSNKVIRNIFIEDSLGTIVGNTHEETSDIVNKASSFVKQSDSSAGQGYFFVTEYDTQKQYVYCLIFNNFGNWNTMSYCYIVFNNTAFDQTFSSIDLPDGSLLFLISDDDDIMASNYDGNLDEISESLREIVTDSEDNNISTFLGKKSLIKQVDLDKTPWRLVSVIPTEKITGPIDKLRAYGFILGIITILLLSSVSFLIARNITRQIRKLSNFVSAIDYKSLDRRIEINGNNEIDQISHSVNTMLEQLKILTKRIFTTQTELYETEIRKRQADLSALQSQINPHFLYNTLDCIRMIAFSYKCNEIVSIANAMSQIFRYNIRKADKVEVREELECINYYISIIQTRFQNRFNIEIDVEEALYALHMQKFILQPIVENAIYHGLEMKFGNGSMKIQGNLYDNDDIIFIITDSGAGISSERLVELKSIMENENYNFVEEKKSIGLTNIDRRLKNVYGKDYGLSIDSELGEWTKVTVRMRKLE